MCRIFSVLPPPPSLWNIAAGQMVVGKLGGKGFLKALCTDQKDSSWFSVGVNVVHTSMGSHSTSIPSHPKGNGARHASADDSVQIVLSLWLFNM